MNYVSVENLTKSYGITPLFKGIHFNINEGDSIALIARNGMGKSTLLKILAGKEIPDAGVAKIHKEVHLVLFEQEPQFIESASITQNIFNQDHPVMKAISNYEMALESEDENLIAQAIVEMEEKIHSQMISKLKSHSRMITAATNATAAKRAEIKAAEEARIKNLIGSTYIKNGMFL